MVSAWATLSIKATPPPLPITRHIHYRGARRLECSSSMFVALLSYCCHTIVVCCRNSGEILSMALLRQLAASTQQATMSIRMVWITMTMLALRLWRASMESSRLMVSSQAMAQLQMHCCSWRIAPRLLQNFRIGGISEVFMFTSHFLSAEQCRSCSGYLRIFA